MMYQFHCIIEDANHNKQTCTVSEPLLSSVYARFIREALKYLSKEETGRFTFIDEKLVIVGDNTVYTLWID